MMSYPRRRRVWSTGLPGTTEVVLVRRVTLAWSVVLLSLTLSVTIVPAANAAFPGGNGDIAFSRTIHGQSDIWIVYAGVTGTTNLTNTAHRLESQPDYNAAGTRIAFTRCTEEFSNCDLWAMDADGANKARLTFTPAVQETWPTWSPDGMKIAYTSDAVGPSQDIWVMDADGNNQTRLTFTAGFDAFPEWSPDGTKIAFTSDRAALDDIWVMDADGSNPMRLTAGAPVDERPDWSPNGAKIAFSRNGNIWKMSANGSNEVQLTVAHGGEFAPAFSPNGKRIAFNRLSKDGNRVNIWIIRADGSGPVHRTFSMFDFFPDWQPT